MLAAVPQHPPPPPRHSFPISRLGASSVTKGQPQAANPPLPSQVLPSLPRMSDAGSPSPSAPAPGLLQPQPARPPRVGAKASVQPPAGTARSAANAPDGAAPTAATEAAPRTGLAA